MACVQVNFVEAFIAKVFDKTKCIILQNQNKCCTEIPATRSVLFLICTMVTIEEKSSTLTVWNVVGAGIM
jgi:hypothetical protein